MQQYSETFMTDLGRPVRPESNPQIAVYTYPGNVLAVLYSDNGVTPKQNPTTTDENGLFKFYAADGRYSLTLTSDVTSSVTRTDSVLLEDPMDNTAAQIGFTAAGTGAVTRTAQSKMRDIVSVKDFGAVGDGSTNDTNAINLAISAAATLGCWLYVPAGTYKVVPATSKTDEAGANICAFPMTNNMHIWAEPGATFRIADGISSDASPTRFSMFFSNVPLSNISVVGLTMDMNGQNNPISPNRGSLNYNLFTQAAILFSGTPAGVAARGDDVFIDRVTVKNTAGVTCIGCMQSNSVGVTLGKRWRITNSNFLNNGLDTSDHSSLYLWSEDIVVENCTFSNPFMWSNTTKLGGVVAIEVHGARQRIANINVENYYQAIWVALNYTNTTDEVVITSVNAKVCGVVIDIDRPNANSTLVDNVEISSGTWVLTDDPVPIDIKVGLQVNTPYKVTNIHIDGVILEKVGTNTPSTFVSIGPQTVASQEHDNIIVSDCTSVGTVFGAYIATNATNGLGSISIKNNKWVNLSPTAAFTNPAGISGVNINPAKAVTSLFIDGNECIDTRGTPLCQYGVYLSGAITNLYVGQQSYVGMTVADYTEVSLTVTNRRGFFNAISFTPSWNAGSAITLGNGSQSASYTLRGDQVTINAKLNVGSTTTFPGGTLFLASPFTSKTSGFSYHGNWRIFDTSAVISRTGVANIDGTSANVTLIVDGAGNATQATPVPLATGDIVSMQITYTRA